MVWHILRLWAAEKDRDLVGIQGTLMMRRGQCKFNGVLQ